ncbi:Mdj1p, partial [Saccharomyces cerevisiae]
SVKLSRGDILVRIRVDKDPNFSIKNKYDIWYDKEIPITTAALGGTVTIPTVEGQKIRIKVAPGTQYNQVISIPNMGVPKTSTIRGDMKVQYKIVVKKPQSLAEKCSGTAINEEILKKQKQEEEKHAKKDDDNTLKRLENFITNTFRKIKGDKKN